LSLLADGRLKEGMTPSCWKVASMVAPFIGRPLLSLAPSLTARPTHSMSCLRSAIKDCIFIDRKGRLLPGATIDYEKLSVQRNAPRWNNWNKTLKKYGYIAA
jgi:hypothetical protein